MIFPVLALSQKPNLTPYRSCIVRKHFARVSPLTFVRGECHSAKFPCGGISSTRIMSCIPHSFARLHSSLNLSCWFPQTFSAEFQKIFLRVNGYRLVIKSGIVADKKFRPYYFITLCLKICKFCFVLALLLSCVRYNNKLIHYSLKKVNSRPFR